MDHMGLMDIVSVKHLVVAGMQILSKRANELLEQELWDRVSQCD